MVPDGAFSREPKIARLPDPNLSFNTAKIVDHNFHTGTIKTVPQNIFVPIFTQELFRVTISERVTFLQNIVCLFSHRNYKNSSSV